MSRFCLAGETKKSDADLFELADIVNALWHKLVTNPNLVIMVNVSISQSSSEIPSGGQEASPDNIRVRAVL